MNFFKSSNSSILVLEKQDLGWFCVSVRRGREEEGLFSARPRRPVRPHVRPRQIKMQPSASARAGGDWWGARGPQRPRRILNGACGHLPAALLAAGSRQLPHSSLLSPRFLCYFLSLFCISAFYFAVTPQPEQGSRWRRQIRSFHKTGCRKTAGVTEICVEQRANSWGEIYSMNNSTVHMGRWEANHEVEADFVSQRTPVWIYCRGRN